MVTYESAVQQHGNNTTLKLLLLMCPFNDPIAFVILLLLTFFLPRAALPASAPLLLLLPCLSCHLSAPPIAQQQNTLINKIHEIVAHAQSQ